MEELAPVLARIPGVVAVALGGSRASGRANAGSDWDFGLYYRGRIETDVIRALGYPGTVVEPGDWGRLVNGGAWLTVDGARVDLLYRNLDEVEQWWSEAREGRYVRDHVEGYVAGMTSYVLVGELALNRVLIGELPRPDFPDALRSSAPPNWLGSAEFSLNVAESMARMGRDGLRRAAGQGCHRHSSGGSRRARRMGAQREGHRRTGRPERGGDDATESRGGSLAAGSDPDATHRPARGLTATSNGWRVEIKFSTLWAGGGYTFQQMRDQEYDVAFLLGLSPFTASA